VGLFRTRARQRLETVRRDQVDESSVGLFYELEWQVTERWRATLGLRGDHYRFDVNAERPANSGEESDSIISPRASLAYAFGNSSELYLSAGRGFHSNDARGTTITVDPVTGEGVPAVDPLVASTGAEVGLKTVYLDRLNSSLALWYLELDSELLFVGDAGATEASLPSRRWGIEFNNHWALNDTWTLEADLAWTDARFTDSAPGEKEIPGAIPFVATTGVTGEFSGGWFASLRLRHYAGYPLTEDDREQADSSTLANLALSWLSGRWQVQVDVLNLFDSSDHDIDYFYASRLPGETSAGVADRHYKVFEPRQLRAQLSLSL